MKSLLTASLVALTLFAGMQSAQAADVGGDVRTNVKAGIVLQTNKGIANTNEAALGSVTGKSTDIGGNFRSNVKTLGVIQSNKGIANKNEVNIGSVTD